MPVERDGYIWSRGHKKPLEPRKAMSDTGYLPPSSKLPPPSVRETSRIQEEFLPWTWAEDRLTGATSYWFSTVSLDGLPHTISAWGIWHSNALYFGSSTETRWNLLLLANSSVSVHLEHGPEVITLEGTVTMTGPLSSITAETIAAEYARKYGDVLEDLETTGAWRLQPRVAHGWRHFPKAMTRWRFPNT